MSQIPVFYVIGHPLGHSMSPFIHRQLFSLQKHNAEYRIKDIEPQNLESQLNALLKKTGGINVTIPYKQAVIEYLDGLRGRAEQYRSVNTIKICQDGYFGYNTDADGFLLALSGGGIQLQGRIVLLGCGGVGRTFACEAALAGCSIVNAVRDCSLEHAEKLRSYVLDIAPGTDYSITTPDGLEGEYELLINATPVGMYPNCDEMPVSASSLTRIAAVFDAVYNPVETTLLRCAKSNGVRVLGGMSMLVWQAAAAHTIWYGAHFDDGDIAQLIEETAWEMQRHFAQ